MKPFPPSVVACATLLIASSAVFAALKSDDPAAKKPAAAGSTPAPAVPQLKPGFTLPKPGAPLPAIGEKLATLTERYGPGQKNAGKIRIPGKDQYYWEIRNIGVNLVFDNDRAVLIVAHGVNHFLTAEEVRELLKVNSDRHGWTEDQESPRWLRHDEKLDAFRERRHEDMFFIRDIAAVEKLGHKVVAGSR